MPFVNGVWTPDHVLRQHQAARDRQYAEVNALAQLTATCQEWTPLLKELDPDLEMVWFDENAKAVGVTPGRFCVVRWNAGAPPGLHPVTGPNGEFCFPNSGIFDKLRESDLWNDRVISDQRKREKRIEEAKARQLQREADERAEEFAERVKAYANPGVSMTGQGKGWGYRAAAPKPKAA